MFPELCAEEQEKALTPYFRLFLSSGMLALRTNVAKVSMIIVFNTIEYYSWTSVINMMLKSLKYKARSVYLVAIVSVKFKVFIQKKASKGAFILS